MPDLVTPTGILLGAPEPRTDEWFALRRGGITATDLPRIMNLVPKYGNPLTVWLDKRGEPVDIGGDWEAAEWGQRLEPLVASVWAQKFGVDVGPVGVLANASEPWQRASLDRLCLSCPDGDGPCGLEIKTRSAYKSKLWGRDVPDDVLAQVLWQIHVAGFGHQHVATLLGGQRLRTYRIDLEGNEKILALLIERAAALWESVDGDVPPEVDPTETLEKILDALYPDRSGEKEVDPGKVAELLAAIEAGREAKRHADKLKAAARAAVKAAMDDADTLTVGGTPIIALRWHDRAGYTVKPTRYQTVDVVGRLPVPDTDDDDMEEDPDDDGES